MNTARPLITGTPKEGELLSTTTGTWTESPTSYTYQWQQCNDDPGTCEPIGGATASTYIATEANVGHSIRVVVGAHAASGEGSKASLETTNIEAKEARTTDCLPRLEAGEACGGYPNKKNTGVEEGVTLTKLVPAGGNLQIKTAETIENKLIEGSVEIRASNVHLKNDEIVGSSQKTKCEKNEGPGIGGGLVQIKGHGTGESELDTGVVIEHVTLHGTTKGCPESLNIGFADRLFGPGAGAEAVRVEWTKVYWTGACFWGGAKWEWDYCEDNTEIPGEHYDGIYSGGGNSPNIINHDVIDVPHVGAGPIALFNEGGEVKEVKIEHDLLAGGGYAMALGYKHAPEAGKFFGVPGPIYVIGNQLTRCLGKSIPGNNGSHVCEGLVQEIEPGVVLNDGHGYFPKGGAFGELNDVEAAVTTFSGNYWGNNLESAL